MGETALDVAKRAGKTDVISYLSRRRFKSKLHNHMNGISTLPEATSVTS